MAVLRGVLNLNKLNLAQCNMTLTNPLEQWLVIAGSWRHTKLNEILFGDPYSNNI